MRWVLVHVCIIFIVLRHAGPSRVGRGGVGWCSGKGLAGGEGWGSLHSIDCAGLGGQMVRSHVVQALHLAKVIRVEGGGEGGWAG